ncbi:putative ribonuclease H-like domain-containing protein [Tanacetum coccineum]|uniref:Ribonuclease H-like domain-containing protein n=1 Tax=Tanacetum coccineum TaxID=301880 RepID=A0ABQ5J8B9_9ASTR
MSDYSLWEVIKNGNKVLKRTVGETEQEYEPTTAEEKQYRRNEMKARGTLLMTLPNKDQLKFHSYKDAKLLMEAIEKMYGGNKESKKVQRTLLKQQYENFAGLSLETMDQTFDRSLPSEWKTHALIWRNKQEIETISLDDLYNNLKIYEPEISGSSSTSRNPQNVTFVSSNSTNSNSSTNEADNTAYEVSAAHTQSNHAFGDNLSDVVICAFLEIAMLTIRARRFIKRTGRKLDVNGQRVRFDRSIVECYNCHKYGHFARECRVPRNQENKGRENNRRTMTVETPTKNALVAQDGIGGYDWSYQAKEEHPTNFALMAHTSLGSSSSSDYEVDSCSKSCVKAYATLKEQYDSFSSYYKSQVIDKFKTGLGYNAASSTAASPVVESFVNSFEMLENQENNKSRSDKGYHAVPPPFTRNFIPFKLDLTFIDERVESENIDVTTIVTPSNVKTVESNHKSADVKNSDAVEPKTVRMNSFRPPVIEDWNFDDDSEGNPQQKEYKEKGVIDSGCSRHMTGNKCYLTEYEDYDGGFVSFGDGKGRISGKGKIKTGTLDFDNVYFCKELKYNLFSVSQICDKKNNVLFTDTECLVLSSDFKLLDESQVLLRVPRKDNIYSVDLKSVVPTKGLTCLFAKATIDESNLWHRRLGHINFKNMNKLVRGNLVRGLPSKIFENDHSCVACQKGKQHKASCKAKLVNSISKPLHMLHMDLFGPTNVKSLMKKSYCLVVTDDFSRFSWVFFLATKDEDKLGYKRPSYTEIVNLLATKVLVIKPHTKTPYELIRGRTPLIDFMKPFGCPVTILNTRDHLGKFDGKADEGFFVGYSVDSEEDVGVKPREVDGSEASDKDGKDCYKTQKWCEGLSTRKKKSVHPNSTNSINTVSTPVSTTEPSTTNDAPSSPVNAAKTSEEHLFEQFSPFKNAFTLPDVPNMSPLDDNTRTFASAYDDEDVGIQEGDSSSGNSRGKRLAISMVVEAWLSEKEEVLSKDKELTPSDIQHSAATQIWGCYRLVSRAKVIENQGADDEEVSKGGIPRVIVLGYDGLPIQPVAPPSPDYIPGPEDPQTPPVPQDEDEREPMFVQAQDPDYVPEPIYPEYIPLEDDHDFLAEEQPLPPSDPEEDPEDYEDDETEDGLVDYPMDGEYDGDDDDGDSSGDDTNDEDKDDEEEEEEEEHLARLTLLWLAEVEDDFLGHDYPSPSPQYLLSPPLTGDALLGACPTGTFITTTYCHHLLHHLGVQPIDTSDSIHSGLIDELLPHYPSPPLPPSLIHYTPIDRRSRIITASRYWELAGVDLLMGDRMTLHETVWMAHQTQLQLQGTLIQTQHQVHETRFQMQQAELAALRETDPRRQAQMVETLRVIRDMRREMSDTQAELLALREQQRRARQPGPEARIPDHQDASGDANSHIQQIMAPTTRRGPNTPVNNTNPNNMTPESIQAMIDQALLRNSTNGDGSHSSHEDNRRNVQTARPCFYADFMKCQPLNFKGTEGVVGLTRWIEKMESVFNISGCTIENQVKFATCTLLGAALT